MGNIILQEALDKFLAKETTKDKGEVPWLIWLMENPKSPLHLHGASALNDHDYVHVILDKGQANDDEAFVIGFTMGNDDRTKNWEVNLFKFVSSKLYPEEARFTKEQLKIFDRGFKYGQSKLPLYQRIGEFNWNTIDKNTPLNEVKRKFNVQ